MPQSRAYTLGQLAKLEILALSSGVRQIVLSNVRSERHHDLMASMMTGFVNKYKSTLRRKR